MSELRGERLARAVTNRVRLQAFLATGIGALVVFLAIGFLIPIFLEPDERWQLGKKNLPLVVLAIAGGGVYLTLLTGWMRRRTLRWVAEERGPTRAEHTSTLRYSRNLAAIGLANWIIGAAVFALINLDHSLGFAAVVATAILVGGETTSALVYLMAERTLRPVTALALVSGLPQRSPSLGVRDRLFFAWSLGTFAPLIGVLVVGVVALTKPDVETEYVAGASVFLGCVAVVTGVIATLFAARAVADPVTRVRRALEQVAAGDLGARVPIDDASEIGQLQAGFNRMATGLRERERIRELFGRHVGEEVAQAALRGGTQLGGEEREVGTFFIDLAGSTSMALALPPTEVVRLLNRFFRVVVEVVEEECGIVNKFEGDAALCVFGAPVPSDDPAGQALRAARRLASCLENEIPEVGFGIGVSAGKVIAGNVGAERRFEYTVIGDPVNEAARLSDLAKERQEKVIAAERALRKARPDEAAVWEVGEQTVLRGRLEATGLAAPRA